MAPRAVAIAARLAAAGCVAAEDEAIELLAVAADPADLEELVERRIAGEPLAWITGATSFCGLEVRVDHGVYVPRWQSEPLAERARACLQPGDLAVDLCTGSGAVAKVMATTGATVVATDIDSRAVDCARANGIDARTGDLFDAVDREWRGAVRVVTAVAPYVPAGHLRLLRSAEPVAALNGGDDGLAVVARIVAGAREWLAPGGHLLAEIGAPQVDGARDLVGAGGLAWRGPLRDGDGDVSGFEAEKSS